MFTSSSVGQRLTTKVPVNNNPAVVGNLENSKVSNAQDAENFLDQLSQARRNTSATNFHTQKILDKITQSIQYLIDEFDKSDVNGSMNSNLVRAINTLTEYGNLLDIDTLNNLIQQIVEKCMLIDGYIGKNMINYVQPLLKKFKNELKIDIYKNLFPRLLDKCIAQTNLEEIHCPNVAMNIFKNFGDKLASDTFSNYVKTFIENCIVLKQKPFFHDQCMYDAKTAFEMLELYGDKLSPDVLKNIITTFVQHSAFLTEKKSWTYDVHETYYVIVKYGHELSSDDLKKYIELFVTRCIHWMPTFGDSSNCDNAKKMLEKCGNKLNVDVYISLVKTLIEEFIERGLIGKAVGAFKLFGSQSHNGKCRELAKKIIEVSVEAVIDDGDIFSPRESLHAINKLGYLLTNEICNNFVVNLIEKCIGFTDEGDFRDSKIAFDALENYNFKLMENVRNELVINMFIRCHQINNDGERYDMDMAEKLKNKYGTILANVL